MERSSNRANDDIEKGLRKSFTYNKIDSSGQLLGLELNWFIFPINEIYLSNQAKQTD